MRGLSSSIYALMCVALLVACNGDGGPMGVMPGGSLGGEVLPPPADWTFAGDAGTMQLETHPPDPYSVNLAYTVLDGRLYVNAGGTETRWAQHIAHDPNVRLRLDGRVYELRARRIDDPVELERFAEAWTSQSFFRRDPLGYEEVWLWELEPR